MTARDIVILFGAGASYGAGSILPAAPPLGKDLYDALAAQYPNEWGAKSHLGRWADDFRKDFEKTMFDEVLQKVDSLTLLERHRLVALFFAKYRLDGSGNDLYSQLFANLKARGLLARVTLSSLNYECLAEQAVENLGVAVDYMFGDAYLAGSIPVAKIHGSSNFVTRDLSSWRHMLSSRGAMLETSFTTLPLLGLEDTLQSRFSDFHQAFFPVLGLYSLSKPSLVAPMKLEGLRAILAARIKDANKVVLIGVRPNDRDPHLWAPVAQSNAAQIGYVGVASDYAALRNFQPKAVHLGDTFEQGFTKVVSFLSS